MSEVLTVEELKRLERLAHRAYAHARLCSPDEALALVAAAKRLIELESALEFLDSHKASLVAPGTQHLKFPTSPQAIRFVARDCGWAPPGEKAVSDG